MALENVLNFTNVDNEDFVGMVTAEEIPVKAGETKAFTETIARHIADQLVTKILIREGKNYISDPKRKVLMKEMLGDVAVAPVAPVDSEVKAETPEEEEEFADLPAKVPAKARRPRKTVKK